MITTNIVLTILGVLMFATAVYWFLRIKTVDWAAKNLFFVSPAFGRIKARIRGGYIIQYIANLKGLDVYIDEETGKISSDIEVFDGVTGELIPRKRGKISFWQKVFGVRFIGLDDVHEYDIEVTSVDKDGVATTETTKAHSLHYSASYHMVITGEKTSEGIPLGLHLRFTLKTHHAGQCLKFKSNWISVAKSHIKAATRDFVGKRGIRSILSMQTELPDSAPVSTTPPVIEKEAEFDFVKLIKSLNNSIKGNPGLIETLGQEIVSVNLESIEIEDKSIMDALIAQERAEEIGKATVAKAKADAEKTIAESGAELVKKLNDVKAAEAKGMAENAVFRNRVDTLGGPKNMVEIEKWKNIGLLKDLKGTLILSNGKGETPSLILNNKGGVAV